MLTIVTALPWEAGRFAARLRDRGGSAPLRVLVSGPGEERAEAAARTLAALDLPAGGILCAGVAGGLDPALRPGDLVLATRIHHACARGGSRGTSIDASAGLGDWLHGALAAAGLEAVRAEVLSRDAILRSAAAKAAAHEESGAVAVQMEDYAWAENARRAGIPFGSLRAVLDPAAATLPRELLDWDPAGPSRSSVAAAVARRPSLAVSLLRLARQRRDATRALDRALDAILEAVLAGGMPTSGALR
jgi:nucleoside phosphorylase